jgi:putative heme degradation protein
MDPAIWSVPRSVQLFDASGRAVAQLTWPGESDRAALPQHLVSGVYVARVSTPNGDVRSIRFIIP